MTPKHAAERIGCTTQQVLSLIHGGRLRAEKIPSEITSAGYYYSLAEADVEAYATSPQGKGWPRGKKREKRKNRGRRKKNEQQTGEQAS
jgi:hypothetical protein